MDAGVVSQSQDKRVIWRVHYYMYVYISTDGPLRQRVLEVEDGARLGAGVVVVQVRELAGQGPAHVLLYHA